MVWDIFTVHMTKKHIKSGAPIKACIELPDFLLEYYMFVYELTEEQAVLFYIQQQQGIEDMDLIYGRYIQSFSFFSHGDNVRITINL